MGPYGHMNWMWSSGHVMWMAIAWLIGGLVIAAVIWAVLRTERKDSPEEILERRLAKGEIDGETYRRKLHELHG